ncbi:uncharacterized protein LOC103525010 [Diaphorina citri]|uniref:Uncharacterized protein LOC103525010 n=1 Tax=Diaphorina citri TaxID=121845 RepID=A0A3Q0IP09_DIACI|nr:uncharacterized protein LOC103525010 [Diaphorina citri]
MVAKIEGIESKSEGKDMNNTALKAKNTEHTLTEISHIINSVLGEVVDEIDKPSVTAENNMNIIPRVKDLDTFDPNVTKANVEDKTNKTSVDEAINTPMAVAQTFIKNIIASVENFLGPSVCDQKKKQIDNISSSNENLMDKKLTQSNETMSSLEKSMMETRESFLAATWNINVESNIMMINSGGTRRFNEKSMTLKISNFDRVQSNQKNLSTLINVEMNCTKQQEDVLNQFEELNRKLEDVKIEPSGSEVCVKDQSMECVPDYTPYYPDENEFNPVEAPEFKINPFECNALLAKYPSNPCTDIMPKIPNGNVPENSRTTFEEFTDSNVQESDDLDNIQIEKEDFGIINLAIDEYLQEEGKADQNIYQNGVSPSNTYTDFRYQMDTSSYQYTSNQQDSSHFMVDSVNPTYRNGFYDASTIPNQLSMQQPMGKPSPYAVSTNLGQIFVQTSSVDTNLSVTSSSTIVPCVYKVYGCPARFSTSDILQHEFTCPYQCIKCPTLACKWYEPLLFFNQHVLTQHLQHVEDSRRALFLIQLDQKNQVFFQKSDPYVYTFITVLPHFIRGQVGFIRTDRLEHNHHYISLNIKSFGVLRTRLTCPVPMFLGENKFYNIPGKKTRFLIKRSPSGQEPKHLELFSEIIVPQVSVQISREERAVAESWVECTSVPAPRPTPVLKTGTHVKIGTINPITKPKPVESKIAGPLSVKNRLEKNKAKNSLAKIDKKQKLAPLVIKNLKSKLVHTLESSQSSSKETKANTKSTQVDKREMSGDNSYSELIEKSDLVSNQNGSNVASTNMPSTKTPNPTSNSSRANPNANPNSCSEVIEVSIDVAWM